MSETKKVPQRTCPKCCMASIALIGGSPGRYCSQCGSELIESEVEAVVVPIIVTSSSSSIPLVFEGGAEAIVRLAKNLLSELPQCEEHGCRRTATRGRVGQVPGLRLYAFAQLRCDEHRSVDGPYAIVDGPIPDLPWASTVRQLEMEFGARS